MQKGFVQAPIAIGVIIVILIGGYYFWSQQNLKEQINNKLNGNDIIPTPINHPTPSPRIVDPSPTNSSDGQICGGLEKIQCPAGYFCSLEGLRTDAPGKCKLNPTPKPSAVGEGQHCGGNVQYPATCSAGYHCQLSVPADVGGVCVKD
jgi:hypothetical protein